MKRIGLFILLTIFLSSACDNRRGEGDTNDTLRIGPDASNSVGIDTTGETADFPMEAASAGMMEVELGNLAQQKAQNAQVKRFGSRMVTDHSKANDELKQIAQQNNITLPDSMMDKHKDMVEELSGFTGAEFDKQYMSMMVDDHKEDVEKFEQHSKENPDSPVGKWAAKTLPVLREHLSQAEQINNNLK